MLGSAAGVGVEGVGVVEVAVVLEGVEVVVVAGVSSSSKGFVDFGDGGVSRDMRGGTGEVGRGIDAGLTGEGELGRGMLAGLGDEGGVVSCCATSTGEKKITLSLQKKVIRKK